MTYRDMFGHRKEYVQHAAHLSIAAMSQLNVLNIKFFVKKSRVKNNRVPLYVRIAYGSGYVDLSLKRDINITNWGCAERHSYRLAIFFEATAGGKATNCYYW
jgi:translation initiation factor 2 alpha subunit (eIF-2alpha)